MKVIFPNLKAELARYGLIGKDVAKALNMTTTNVYYKLSGKVAINYNDMMEIKELLDKQGDIEYTLDYLFKKGV